jgi:hypothetical protein
MLNALGLLTLFGLSVSALPAARQSDASYRSALQAFVNPQNLAGFGGKIACRTQSSTSLVIRRQPHFAQVKLSEGPNADSESDSKEQALRNLAAAGKPPKPADPPKSKEDPSIVDQLLGWINSDEVLH